MYNVLVVEDDHSICELLAIHLKSLNCHLSMAYDGVEGMYKALNLKYDLIILDLMLPGGIDGFEICREIRAKGIITPVMMLTARAEEIDKVLGLEMGADDYLTKPFSLREFVARVKAIFRRAKLMKAVAEKSKNDALEFGDLSIEVDKHKVSIRGQRIELSPKEFELLVLLASKPGRSYSRSQILNLVWGYDFSGYEHTVNAHINRLRAKIEPDLSKPTYILTTWGVGYRFTEDVMAELGHAAE